MNPDDYDFDHPSSFDFDEIILCLGKLLNGEEVEIPNYSFVEHARMKERVLVKPTDILIFEGIMSLHKKEIRDMLDLKIFIDCELDIALARRISRDIRDRGRDVHEVLGRFNRFVRKNYKEFVLPTMKFADLVVPGGGPNHIALNLLLEFLSTKFSRTSKSSLVFPWKTMIKAQEKYNSLSHPENCFVLDSQTFSMNIRAIYSDLDFLMTGNIKLISKGLALIIKTKADYVLNKSRHYILQNQDKPSEAQDDIKIFIFTRIGQNEIETLQPQLKSDEKSIVISLISEIDALEKIANQFSSSTFISAEQTETFRGFEQDMEKLSSSDKINQASKVLQRKLEKELVKISRSHS